MRPYDFIRSAELTTFMVLTTAMASLAQTPLATEFTYQGQLKESGLPALGTYDFQFRLFDAAAGGTQVGTTECVDGVVPVDGLFAVELDFGATPFEGNAAWLEIAVRNDGMPANCSGGTAYTVLAARQPITATPYALYALNGPGSAGPWAVNGSTIYNSNGGNVGIGAPDPLAKLHVAGGRCFVENNLDVGVQAGGPYKITAINQTDHAIFGKVEADSGSFAYGVYGQSDSVSGGGGVFGIAPIYGVRGLSVATAGTSRGGEFTTNSTEGEGVLGYASADTGLNYGIRGRTDSAAGFAGYFEGRGYFSGHTGIGTQNPAARLHVEGGSDSSPGGGGFIVAGNVGGANLSLDNNEIMARSNGVATDLFLNHDGGDLLIGAGGGVGNVGIGTASPTQARVQIATTNQRCIYGENNSDSWAAALFINNGTAPAGLFNGAVSILGNLSKSSGSFRIDHPLDPANKYLYHSFVESPDMKNLYDGVVQTDQRGYATIELPDWFEPLNRDFRYQLTIIDAADGEEFAQAKIVREITHREFTIRTSRGRVKVSWQVTGTRKDPWAEAHRIPVEEKKPAHLRGTYQHPELYGLSREFGEIAAPQQLPNESLPRIAD